MSLFTSSHFASAAASGADWREVTKTVLEKIDEVKTEGAGFNLGFLYISDHLTGDAESIVNLFKSVLGIDHWVGANAVGVLGCGEAFIDTPAISAMVGKFDPDSFCLFPPILFGESEAGDTLAKWQKEHDPMLVLTHGDPVAEEDPAIGLEALNNMVPGFMVGGLSSSRWQQMQISSNVHQNGVSGVAFADSVRVATMLSQGCMPIGKMHDITRCDEHTVLELDSEKAVRVFEQDLRDMAIQKVGKDPDDVEIDRLDIETASDMPQEFQSLMKGEMHVAFPVSESDQKDYLVRNIVGLDPDEGSITVSQYLANGEQMMFVHRDANTVREDLSKSLVDLCRRVTQDMGSFEPKGALYISCAGRAKSEFENDFESEIQLIHDVIGDVPLCGFYAGGEILNARLYGYTGILTLFL
jgi:small ligand-binding sensory domain FIST